MFDPGGTVLEDEALFFAALQKDQESVGYKPQGVGFSHPLNLLEGNGDRVVVEVLAVAFEVERLGGENEPASSPLKAPKVVGWPLVDDGVSLVIGCGDGELFCLLIDEMDQGEAKEESSGCSTNDTMERGP